MRPSMTTPDHTGRWKPQVPGCNTQLLDKISVARLFSLHQGAIVLPASQRPSSCQGIQETSRRCIASACRLVSACSSNDRSRQLDLFKRFLVQFATTEDSEKSAHIIFLSRKFATSFPHGASHCNTPIGISFMVLNSEGSGDT